MLNLANKITLLRMLITPVVICLLYCHGPVTCTLAAFSFILAAFTDWYDGYVARHENMVTNMGKFLDPLADKVLICSVLIMFTALGWVQAWIVIIIVCRELIVTGLRAIAIDEGITMGADKFGKAKTVTQILAIVPLCLHYPVLGVELWHIGEVLLYAAMILAVYSCFNYCVSFLRELHAKRPGDAKAGTLGPNS
ncbi:MAG: CDP-diacylglycerol--glycerol-3-phosphate 3-phosphatidyltransferase [Desulfovibrio sp.]|nr:CDP-diacylglycerol--glycerol-3-phosphate 3-phosphatidyltransferase [Desulfovibrio sp.]